MTKPNPLTTEYPQADLSDLTGVNIMGDHLLLRMYPEVELTEGGIHLTENSQERRMAAWVIGCGVDIDDAHYHVGDTIMCPTASLMNVLPELGDHNKIRYILARDVVLHWPGKEVSDG